MSEYAYCWRVQDAYALTDIQRKNLVSSLIGVSDAVQECCGWDVTGANPSLEWSTYSHIVNRMAKWVGLVLNPKSDETGSYRGLWAHPETVLTDVIRRTYEGEKPESDILKSILKGDYKDILERFSSLYLDSLLLRRTDVRAYCQKHQIPQAREVKGFMWKDNIATLSQQSPAKPVAVSVTLAQGGSRPETDKRDATQVACEKVIGAIMQGLHLDPKGKIGMNEFLSLVRDTMKAQGRIGLYQLTAARKTFYDSTELEPLKRGRGEKP